MRKLKVTLVAVAFRKLGRRIAAGVVVGIFLALEGLGLGQAVAAQTQGDVYQFDIPAQKLNDALQVLAVTSQHKLLYSSKWVDGRESPELKGEFTAEEAVARLLAGTGLEYQITRDGLVVIRGRGEKPVAGLVVGNNGSRVAEGEAAGNGAGQETGEKVELTEIIVTAQKRPEPLQHVPMSISVLEGSALDKASFVSVGEALTTLPGVAVTSLQNGNPYTGGMQISVRGVSSANPLVASSSPIAFYLDGVPFSLVKSALVPDVSSFDLDRVEVLRGPQGTLYGANAEDGVVRVLTNKADLSGFDFKAHSTVAATDRAADSYRGDMAMNMPIVKDVLAVRAVVSDERVGGWIDTPIQKNSNNADLKTARIKLDAQPTEAMYIDLSAWHQQDFYAAPGASTTDFTYSALDAQPTKIKYNVFGANVSYKLPQVSVSSNTSYLEYASASTVDLTPLFGPFIPEGNESALYTDINAHTFSEELLFNSELAGPWRWSAGFAYRDSTDSLHQDNEFLQQYGGLPYTETDRSQSQALFGEIGRRFLSNKMELTLGGRYYHDKVSIEEVAKSVFESRKNSAATPRVVLTWDPSRDFMAYASYSQGFRSGFSQNYSVIVQHPGIPPVEPDKLYNYELGAKGTLWDGRVSFNAAAYYVHWKDVQQILSDLYQGSYTSQYINGQSASGPGFEFAMMTHPIHELDVGINLGWNKLTMDAPVNSGGMLLFAEGQRLNFSPEYTAGASMGYSLPVGGTGFIMRFAASVNYTSEQQYAVQGGPPNVGDSVWLSRAAVSLNTPTHWGITAFGDNLSNSRGGVVPSEVDGNGLIEGIQLPRPRTIGIQVDYRLK